MGAWRGSQSLDRVAQRVSRPPSRPLPTPPDPQQPSTASSHPLRTPPDPQQPTQWGQLGTGNNVNYTSLRPVLEPGTGSGFLTGASWLAVGGYFTNGAPSGHSCACMNDGRAFCWGQNYGQARPGFWFLGPGRRTVHGRACLCSRRAPPLLVARTSSPPLLSAPQLAAAVPLTTTSVNRPVAVVTDAAGATPMTNCRAIAANLNHTVFLTADGSVHTAGRNGCERSPHRCACAHLRLGHELGPPTPTAGPPGSIRAAPRSQPPPVSSPRGVAASSTRRARSPPFCPPQSCSSASASATTPSRGTSRGGWISAP